MAPSSRPPATLRTCSFCDASLGWVVSGDIRCGQCGSINRIEAIHAPDDNQFRGDIDDKNAKTVRLISLVFASIFLGGVVYAVHQGLSKLTPKVYDEPPQPIYRAANLHDLGDPAAVITPIDPAGLSKLSAFDPIAALPWFENLARTWSTDARLVSLELHGVRALGTLDVATPGSDPFVRYQFASKARSLVAKKLAKANATLAWSAIDVVLKRGVMTASVVANASEDRDPSPAVFECGIPQLIDMWRTKGLSSRPTYDVELEDGRGPKLDYVWQSKDDHLAPIGTDCRFRLPPEPDRQKSRGQ
jgi:hypothetical protein